MTMRHVFLVVCATFVLAGCQTSAERRPEVSANIIAAQGTYVHAPSGMTFPEEVAGFRRERVSQFDEEGFAVSARYDLLVPRRRVVAAVFVYPTRTVFSIDLPGTPPEKRAKACQVVFEAQKQEFLRAYSGARVLEEWDMPVPASGPLIPGRVAKFAFEEMYTGYAVQAESELYVFCSAQQEWAISYQFMWQSGAWGFYAGDVVSRFIAELPWTISTGPQ